jgi:hypothetical protein
MEPVYAEFAVIKVDDNTYDVIIMGEEAMLKSFVKVYDKLFFIEESVFGKKPAVVAPDFPNSQHAETWKQYWVQAFADPDNSCETCPTVKQLLGFIEQARKEKTQ